MTRSICKLTVIGLGLASVMFVSGCQKKADPLDTAAPPVTNPNAVKDVPNTNKQIPQPPTMAKPPAKGK